MTVDPRVVAAEITKYLSSKRGSAIEVTSITHMLTARGVPQATIHAALWMAHSAGWLKKSGKGKVAATARAVRAQGVPQQRQVTR